MSRKPNIDRPTHLDLHLPVSMRARIDLLLFSPLEGRVPKGAYLNFFMERLKEYFDKQDELRKENARTIT